MTMTLTDFFVGQAIYYSGDSANCADYGQIAKLREADKYAPATMDIRLVDGREFHWVYYQSFNASPGRRFWIASEWDAKLKQGITKFIEDARKREHFGFNDPENQMIVPHELTSTCCEGECCKGRHL